MITMMPIIMMLLVFLRRMTKHSLRDIFMLFVCNDDDMATLYCENYMYLSNINAAHSACLDVVPPVPVGLFVRYQNSVTIYSD